MDFSRTETQEAIEQLGKQIVKGSEDVWADLRKAGLLEVEELDDVLTLIVQVGRGGARAPVLETLILGRPIRQAGIEGADGVLTAGMLEPGSRDPRRATTVVEEGRATGTKLCVPAADQASHMVVPATDGLYAVALADCAVTLSRGTNEEPLGTVVLDGAPAIRLAGRGAVAPWLSEVDLGISALHLGLAREALIMTAKYATERQQFGRPIGTFQAVSQRLADAWIELQAMELTLWQAAWRVQEGMPAEREVAIARAQAARGSHFVVAAAQHVHGGMGFDKDYPLYRYFLTSKAWEFVGGGESAQLERLGDVLAAG